MVDKKDRPLHLDQLDEQNLLKRKGKREDGMIYAHVNGISGWFHISQIPIKELDNKTVIEYVQDIQEKNDKKDEQVEVLKTVLMETRKTLKKLKEKVEKYVV